MVYESSYESGHRPFQPDTKRGYWSNPHDFIYAGMSLAFRLDVMSLTWFLSYEFSEPKMVYESSYENGHRPFVPDTKRGYWANPNDFIYAGLALVMRLDVMPFNTFLSSGLNEKKSPLVSLAIYIVPFMVIQSFMGQFSSSGFISAFRLSPLFKGIGYVTLALNICVLTYYSIFAMVPLVYMFASMQPTLPWSCEGFKTWARNLTADEETNLCNIKFENSTDDDSSNSTEINYDYINHHIPSVLYFKTIFNDLNMFSYEDVEYSMSWQLILCAILVWAIVAFIIYKYFNTEKFGQMIRYAVWTISGLLLLFILRFSFLSGAGKVYSSVFTPTWHQVAIGFSMIPIYSLSSFGPGWGLFITLSSFNKFKTNVMKSSWIIGLGQLFIILALNLLTHFTERFFHETTNGNYYSQVEHIWTLYLSTGSVMAHMGWANLWSILFFFMLFLAALTMIIIQLYTVLTTIFDEFVTLRERKFEVCMGLIAIMSVCSLYFTSNHGVTYFTALSMDTNITQVAINLLLILVVLWIYGRVRFQRDIEFMINMRFSTWMINFLRFVAPLGMLLVLIGALFMAFYEHSISGGVIALYAIIFIVLPWLFIPAYAVRSMLQSMGSMKIRFQRCCRPTDWYPVETEERQRYEEAMGNMDITHQLNEITEEVL